MNEENKDQILQKWKLCIAEIDPDQRQTSDIFEKLENKKVLVACSGGPDSVALAIICKVHGIDFALAYIEHGLNEQTKVCESLVKELANICEVPFYTAHLNLESEAKSDTNIEAIARKYRYEALQDIAGEKDCDVILTGHHQDDVAETFLINLIRGSGSGISSLVQSRENIFRPLLHWRKHNLASLAMSCEIEFFEDQMNADSRFVRNRIRHDIIPLLNEVAERDVVPLIWRASRHFQNDNLYLETFAATLWPKGEAKTRDLVQLDPTLQAHALRAWLKGYPPSEVELERIFEVVNHERKSVQISGHRTIWRSGAVLYQDVTSQPLPKP